MYERAPRASAWPEVDNSVETLPAPHGARQGEPPPIPLTSLVAGNAFEGQLGRCIALKAFRRRCPAGPLPCWWGSPTSPPRSGAPGGCIH
jgi:hypothetical protein